MTRRGHLRHPHEMASVDGAGNDSRPVPQFTSACREEDSDVVLTCTKGRLWVACPEGRMERAAKRHSGRCMGHAGPRHGAPTQAPTGAWRYWKEMPAWRDSEYTFPYQAGSRRRRRAPASLVATHSKYSAAILVRSRPNPSIRMMRSPSALSCRSRGYIR